MNKLAQAMQQETNVSLTDNGGITNYSSLNAPLDFFFVGPVAKRNPQDAVDLFKKAYAVNSKISLRILQWVRDVRGGAGARQAFRDCFAWLMDYSESDAIAILNKIAEIGRWDDVLVALFSKNESVQDRAVELIRKALLVDNNGLCAKWMPRKGKIAVALRSRLQLSPKAYRKLLVNLSKTVEQQMCANDWNNINYSHVPSLATARYRSAFELHDPVGYRNFVDSVNKGEAKMNASAIFPHDIVAPLPKNAYMPSVSETVRKSINAQWRNLPDYLEGKDAGLVVADVSGSMGIKVSGSTTALDVCIALAMYMAERNKGPFKDTFITFSGHPTLQKLTGEITDRYSQLVKAQWEMNTNIEAVFNLILNTAVKHNVPVEEMPKIVTIISDMEFDNCVSGNSALTTLKHKYEKAGYSVPKVVFWNVNGRSGNVPATSRDKNVALISGYSPAIAKSVLGAEDFDPIKVMIDTVMIPRYDLI